MSKDTYADRTRAFYRAEVQRHGLNFRGLGFNRRSSQERRFEALVGVGELSGSRVLDVGAGLGDLYAYLRARDIGVAYTGLELCEHLAEAAQRRFAGQRARFLTGDVLEHPRSDEEEYDFVLASGIFGLETGETRARLRPTLERLLALSKCAVAVNFLSARAAKHAERSTYFEPTEVLACAMELTPAVTLRHDYLPNDFTLYLHPRPTWPVLGGSSIGTDGGAS